MGVTRDARARIHLPAVEARLRETQRRLQALGGRDRLDDRVLDNLLAGYAYVNRLVEAGIDVFAMGNLKHLLELNRLVLCGASDDRRVAYARHLAATEERFYGDGGDGAGGVRDVVEWVEAHRDVTPWERAAGVYVTMLSRPQLFIEGNHRTGGLVMAYVLAREGRPPFVLSADNAPAYFELSAEIRDTATASPAIRFRLTALTAAVGALLAAHADPAHLV